jgi:hypothetical protein
MTADGFHAMCLSYARQRRLANPLLIHEATQTPYPESFLGLAFRFRQLF